MSVYSATAATVTGVGIGLIDGFVSSTDSSAGRTSFFSQRSSYFQMGWTALGLLGLTADQVQAAAPVFDTGAALIVRRLVFNLAQHGQTSPAPAQGYVTGQTVPPIVEVPNTVAGFVGIYPAEPQAPAQRLQPTGRVA